jgi:hypothetical protein
MFQQDSHVLGDGCQDLGMRSSREVGSRTSKLDNASETAKHLTRMTLLSCCRADLLLDEWLSCRSSPPTAAFWQFLTVPSTSSVQKMDLSTLRWRTYKPLLRAPVRA